MTPGAEPLVKAASGERLTAAEVEALYHLPLPEVAAVAHGLRLERRDPDVVTFLIDRNINYTNVCNVGCNFCAFYRTKRQADSYTMDYEHIPTAVFTHPPIGTVGLTEAQARARVGTIRVYRSDFRPLKHTLSGRDERCLVKLIVDDASDRVLSLHMVGADAGEIVQGFAVAMRCGATKAQFDTTLGIHPTLAEEFVTLREPVART